MKKLLLSVLAGLFITTGTAQAIEVDALVGLDARGSNTGRFYYPLMNDIDLVVSKKLWIPGEKTSELAADLSVGVALDIPVFGRHSISVDITKSNTQGSAWMSNVINVEKNFLYNLTDQVKIGFTINALSVNLEKGNRSATLFGEIYPVLGATIELM
jgi:hypothetical protein